MVIALHQNYTQILNKKSVKLIFKWVNIISTLRFTNFSAIIIISHILFRQDFYFRVMYVLHTVILDLLLTSKLKSSLISLSRQTVKPPTEFVV